MSSMDTGAIIEDLVLIAEQAGTAIMDIYGQDFEVVH